MRQRLQDLLSVIAIGLAAVVVGPGPAAAVQVAPPPQPVVAANPVVAISPTPGALVGIAEPVTIRFAGPVADRAAAERGISVNALAGMFTWKSDKVVQWTSRDRLPASSHLHVTANGVHTQFDTDPGILAEGNMTTHTFTVFAPGQLPRPLRASMGRPGRETPEGIFPVMEKLRTVVMDSRTIGIPLDDPDGYLIRGEFAERLTPDGVFVHSAPWSVDQQGVANVSHGCINLAPDDAEWYFNTVNEGDPVAMHW